jgi:hypothetical protein
MSVGGVRVRISQRAVVPDKVCLVHLREWFAYEAKIVWRRADGNFGLQFTRAYDLDGATKPELKAMREYCVAYKDAR